MARAPRPEPVDERPRWRVNAKSFIGHAIVEEGAEIAYDPDEDEPKTPSHIGENLSPLNEAAQAFVDAQARPHPDKSTGKRFRTAKVRADAAAAGVGGDDGEGDGDLA